MKKALFFLVMLFPVILLTCTDQKVNPIEGFWDLQFYEWKSPDTTILFSPGDLTKQVKVYGKTHWAFVNEDPNNDTTLKEITYGGAGTYWLKGDTLFETIELFPWKDDIGATVAYTLKIQGDSLIQSGPLDIDLPEGWKNWSMIEVYTRLE